MPRRHEQIEGGLLGLLIGDALGVPYEFHGPEQLPERERIELEPPTEVQTRTGRREFRRAHPGVPPGTWSDDGAQALCLLASLLERGRLDLADFGKRMVRWHREGYLAVDGRVFDVGIQTHAALNKLEEGMTERGVSEEEVAERGVSEEEVAERGVSEEEVAERGVSEEEVAKQAGPRGEWDNGNGSLMRVLPLALWHRGDDRALIDDAMRSSLPTHGHLRSQLCCAVYCLWARRVLDGFAVRMAWAQAVSVLEGVVGEQAGAELEALDLHRKPGGRGSGYVVDCLHSARLALEEDSYEAVVKAAVAIGNDTDTTAAVAGGIAGLHCGTEGIPARWRRALRGRELLDPLLDRLLDHSS